MRVGFVVQRCGREVNGGAELHCLQVAQRMAKHWETEVLTTCAIDYMTWENFYPPGVEEIQETRVRRFAVDQPRDVESFNFLSGNLQGKEFATLPQQEDWMCAQGPISSGLMNYLTNEKNAYDAFIFFGYLYASTYFGLPLVQEKAYLAPLAHEEWPIHLTMWDKFFTLPKQLIFNTSFERDFLRQRFPGQDLRGPVVGVGIEAPSALNPKAFRARYQLNDSFLLYVGRIDASKGCAWLLENFIEARKRDHFKRKLVLIGTEVMPLPFHDDVIHLGFVEEQQKWDAMAACEWLVMPSPHESLSLVLLETWAAGRPVIVTAKADVLTGHCGRAHGGLWYRDWQELETIVTTVGAEEKAVLGQQGQKYVATEYSWQRVEQDYLELFATAAAPAA